MLFGLVMVQLETDCDGFLLTFFSCFSRSVAMAVALELGSPRVNGFPRGFHVMVDFSLLLSSKIEEIYIYHLWFPAIVYLCCLNCLDR